MLLAQLFLATCKQVPQQGFCLGRIGFEMFWIWQSTAVYGVCAHIVFELHLDNHVEGYSNRVVHGERLCNMLQLHLRYATVRDGHP